MTRKMKPFLHAREDDTKLQGRLEIARGSSSGAPNSRLKPPSERRFITILNFVTPVWVLIAVDHTRGSRLRPWLHLSDFSSGSAREITGKLSRIVSRELQESTHTDEHRTYGGKWV